MSGRNEIRYARSGDLAIGFAVSGEGPRDLVFAHGHASNVQIERETDFMRAFHDRCASFARFVVFDRRGTGLSDRPREPATLEARMDDVRAVMDAVGSERAVLFGTFEAASMCVLFAATYPERTLGLVLYNPTAKGTWAPDYPWAPSEKEWRAEIEETLSNWGSYEHAAGMVRAAWPIFADDEEFIEARARQFRLAASPGAVATILRMAADVDVRDVLGAIRVRTLVANHPLCRDAARYVTAHIPGSQAFEVPGPSIAVYLQTETLLPEVERFMSTLEAVDPETVLSTILFTDIVGSTEKLSELGDARWRALIERHHAVVRAQLSRFRGRELDTAGDGFFASFDGPIRAIRCAHAIRDALSELGLRIRSGLHTGECELVGEKLTGLAVNVCARIAAKAGPGEVLVSSTVRDLVRGSDLQFEKHKSAELKGIPGHWQLYTSKQQLTKTVR
jgi:class 3 adenylate cyclase